MTYKLFIFYGRSVQSPIINTVIVEIFAQYIFSGILRMVSYARKYDVNENLNQELGTKCAKICPREKVT